MCFVHNIAPVHLLHVSTVLTSCMGAGSSTAAQAAQHKPAVNGRPAAAAQQWQSPQPSPRPSMQDPNPASDAARMSPEFKVTALLLVT